MRTTQLQRVEADDVRHLRSLAELDYDLVRAYQAAVSRVEDDDVRRGMRLIAEDHQQHLAELNDEIVALGGDAWVEEDFRQLLERGKVWLASLAGDDRIVKALIRDEQEVSRAYANVNASLDLSPRMRRLLDAHIDDDREHKAWLDQALYALSE